MIKRKRLGQHFLTSSFVAKKIVQAADISKKDIVGKAGLTEIDLKYMDVGDIFEKEFLTQATDENRTIEETLGILWKVVSQLPKNELTKVKDKYVEQHYQEK